MRARTAPRMIPTSRTTLHVTHDPPHHAFNAGRGEAQRTKSYCGKNPAPLARAPFWAWPNNVSRLCVAQARGLLSVYKRRGTSFYPFHLCTDSWSRAHSHTEQGRGGVPKARGDQRQRQDQRTQESKRARRIPPARPLPGQLARCQQSGPPLSPWVPTPPTTLETRLGRCLCGGMQIFVKIMNTQDKMRTRRRRPLTGF